MRHKQEIIFIDRCTHFNYDEFGKDKVLQKTINIKARKKMNFRLLSMTNSLNVDDHIDNDHERKLRKLMHI